MAPRSRSCAANTTFGASATASIADLPDALLARCLGHLEFKERQRLALVSKRFAAAACSPELLQEVDADELSSVAALRSFAFWLLRHRQHVRRLACTITDQEQLEAATATASCLTAAGAAGQLERLELYSSFGSTEWLLAMRSLRQLRLVDIAGAVLRISPAISSLTALRLLELDGDPVKWCAGAALPTSITWLELADNAAAMPEQVAQLPHLAHLMLTGCNYSSASMGALSRLAGSLTALEVQRGSVPASLAALTRLQHFGVHDTMLGGGNGSILEDALQHLTQLTHLVLLGSGLRPPATLAGLVSLQHCYLGCTSQRAAGAGAAQPPPLPAGPWLHGLRWLGIDSGLMASSAAVLHAASQLEVVEVTESEPENSGGWYRSPGTIAFFHWLAQHPPLTCVSFQASFARAGMLCAFDSRSFAARLLQLGRDRPTLQVRCSDQEGDFSVSLLDQLTPE